MQPQQTTYRGISAYHLSNDVIELIVLTGVGPRIIHAGLSNGGNLFAVLDEHFATPPDNEYRFFGGHRLWHAPEHPVRTYQPDNTPVAIALGQGVANFTQATEAHTGIQKSLTVHMGTGNRVEVVHTLTNHGAWPVKLAVWTLSMMAPGGVAVLPLPPRTAHGPDTLLPNSHLTLWPYIDLSDPRWTFCRDYILLRQDPQRPAPLKIGASLPAGWLAYTNAAGLFIKRFATQPDTEYPDGGSQAELYTDNHLLELEALSPLVTLAPGGTITHSETWDILPPVPLPTDDASVNTHIIPNI